MSRCSAQGTVLRMFSVKYFANELCQENDPFAEPVLCCTVHTQKEAFDAGCIYQKTPWGVTITPQGVVSL